LPLFSVIIPTFNRAALIARTLDSVLGQTLADLEVIVVDDGSTDSTPAVVANFGARVKFLQQQNRGPGAARNVGLRSATGEFVAFLDSDDLWFPWSAAAYAEAIQQYNPVFIAGKPLIFDSESEISAATSASLRTVVFTDYFASSDDWRWYSASSFVMNRQMLLDAGGFTDEWINAEDADAAMRMGVTGVFLQITSPFTFAWRRHAGSAMSDLTRNFKGIASLVDLERAGRFPGGGERAADRRRIISRYVRPLTLNLLAAGRWAEAWQMYRQTFSWHVAEARVKYLAGFPLKSAVRIFQRGDRKDHA
jgi:Glycosyl transferase family 2